MKEEWKVGDFCYWPLNEHGAWRWVGGKIVKATEKMVTLEPTNGYVKEKYGLVKRNKDSISANPPY